MTGMQCYVMLSTMSVRPDMATVKPRLPRNSLWLIFVSLGTILSGCSLDPLAQRPEAASPQPAPSAELLRQAEAHGFAEGFKAGRRFQEARDHDLASGTPAAPTPLLPVTTGEARIAAAPTPSTLPTITVPAATPPAAPASAPVTAPATPAPPVQAVKPQPASTPVQPPGSTFVPSGTASPLNAAPDPF